VPRRAQRIDVRPDGRHALPQVPRGTPRLLSQCVVVRRLVHQLSRPLPRPLRNRVVSRSRRRSMSNEWNQCACKWAGAHAPSPCPHQRDPTDPGCGEGGSNSPAADTPIWDALFRVVHAEDPSAHLMSIHNNGYLYNYSRSWISHFSIQVDAAACAAAYCSLRAPLRTARCVRRRVELTVCCNLASPQHTHNKPSTLWRLYGRKPFVWDEVQDRRSNGRSLVATASAAATSSFPRLRSARPTLLWRGSERLHARRCACRSSTKATT
jgi:hypothetical protein